MRYDDKMSLKKYFNNIDNKNILLKIFTKHDYDYFIKCEVSNINESKIKLI